MSVNGTPTQAVDAGDLSLRRLIAIARRWWWLVVVGCLLAGGAAAFATAQQTPIYQARALLLVNLGQNVGAGSYQDILGSQKLTETYAELVTSGSNLELALNALPGLSLDIDQLNAKTSARALRNTQLIEVTAEDPDPEVAALLANATAGVFPDYIVGAQLAGAGSGTERQVNTVFLAETASAPDAPVRPNQLLNIILGTILGFVVISAAVALLEYLDDTIHDRKDVERLGVAHLADIPVSGKSGLFRDQRTPSFDTDQQFAEAFRQLYSNLQFVFSTGDVKSILITSPRSGDGKSLVAINLATALAESGQRVLLIDGDLRRPTLHEKLSLPNGSGLSSAFLIGGDHVDSVMQELKERLFVLTSGPPPPNPSALLASEEMQTIVTRTVESFDRVIIDSPPLEGLSDASILMRHVDGVLLVTNTGRTRTEMLNEAAAHIERSGVPLLGVVLNRSKLRRDSSYYAYYGQRAKGQASATSK
jgi:tyrosine-protein kinase